MATVIPARPATAFGDRARWLRVIGIAVGTAALLALALTLNLLPRAYEVHEGDVALYTIRAPRKVSFVSQTRTRQARELAASQIAPVVDMDFVKIAGQRRALADLVQAVTAARSGPNRTAEQRQAAVLAAAQPPLSEQTARRIATMDDATWASVAAETQRLLWDVLKERIPDETVQDVRSTLPLRVTPLLDEGSRAVAVEMASRFVVGNLVVNQDATDRARRDAQDAVAPVTQTYERGQTVVRDGQVIGPVEMEDLETLNLLNPDMDWRSLGSSALLAVTLVGILAGYVWHFDRRIVYRERRMILLASLIVVTTVAAKMVIPGRPLWVYVFPLPTVAMLLASLLDGRLAIAVGLLLSIVVAWIAGGSLEIAVLMTVGSTVGALAVWRKERLFSYFLAGAYVAVAEIAVYSAFFIANRSDDFQSALVIGFELLVNGALSALLTVGSYALLGRIFGILTTMQLLELANPTQPLLRRLLLEAPGTYHHSIMVGNLAERAAEVVGANSLVVRVAAYYHDIGKLERPWAFIENQADPGENVHNSLEPEESARLIASHVTDGVKLAERYGLPASISELIPQHHGTRSISFFLQQAQESRPDSVDPSVFQYPGPRPQSREAAILMLSDSTEAAARASRDHSREAIEHLVESIVRQRLEEGQFDECNLTLRDLTRIKQSFITLLTGIYHPRIPYPPAKPRLLSGARAAASATGDVAV